MEFFEKVICRKDRGLDFFMRKIELVRMVVPQEAKQKSKENNISFALMLHLVVGKMYDCKEKVVDYKSVHLVLSKENENLALKPL